MKNGIFIVNAGGMMEDNARRSIDAAAGRWGCDQLIVQTSASPLHPACWKTHAFDRAAVHGLERLLILDADVVISGCCPNPFTTFPAERMVVVSDRQTHNPARDKAEVDEIEIVTGQRHRPEQYFNSGMVLASRAPHGDLFLAAAELCNRFPHLCWHDQTPFNLICGPLGAVLYADETWNFCNPSGRMPGWERMQQTGKFIYHFPGNPDRNRHIAQTLWQ